MRVATQTLPDRADFLRGGKARKAHFIKLGNYSESRSLKSLEMLLSQILETILWFSLKSYPKDVPSHFLNHHFFTDQQWDGFKHRANQAGGEPS